MRTDIKLTSIDTQAKKNTLSITHANPNASNYAMRTLAQKINALTTNTYSGASRVDTTDLTNAVEKLTPTFTVSPTTIVSSATGAFITLTYNGDADKFIFPIPNATGNVLRRVNISELTPLTGAANQWTVKLSTTGTGVAGDFVIQAPETTNYKAAEVSVKINAID